jgi:micrococcal nuclease
LFSYNTRMSQRLLPTLPFLCLLLLLLPGGRAFAGARDRAGDAAKVWRVDDGDTVTVLIGGGREKTRLIGLDAPEMGQGLWGKRAKRHLEDMLHSSRDVYLEYDVEKRDKYGRLLVYMRTSGGKFVNAVMLKEGYAVLFTLPPNVKHAKEFASAQRQAREGRLGIWDENGLSQRPVEWRKQHPRR